MFKIFFINHASVGIEYQKKILLMDLWVEGSVFNNSWNLISKTPTKSIEVVKKSDFVWYTHEHPDHFNPRNLLLYKDGKNFIFQKTKDKRVVNFLKKISTNVIELDSKSEFKFLDNFSIKVFPFQDIDSFGLISINGKKILNMNDCYIKRDDEISKIKEITGGNIDILLAQFSYAIGNTNINEKDLREENASEILDRLKLLINHLRPKYFIPFASFSYFSNKDNFYNNDSINKIDRTINFLEKNCPNIEIICLYPGDQWNFGTSWSNMNSLIKYKDDYDKIKIINFDTKKFDLDELKKLSLEFINKIKKNNNLFYIYYALKKKYFKITFFIYDLKLCLDFDYKNGIVESKSSVATSQYCKLSSETIFELFSTGFGYDTLQIGGRYQTDLLGKKALENIFKFAIKNYRKKYYNFSDSFVRFLKKFLISQRINPLR